MLFKEGHIEQQELRVGYVELYENVSAADLKSLRQKASILTFKHELTTEQLELLDEIKKQVIESREEQTLPDVNIAVKRSPGFVFEYFGTERLRSFVRISHVPEDEEIKKKLLFEVFAPRESLRHMFEYPIRERA